MSSYVPEVLLRPPQGKRNMPQKPVLKADFSQKLFESALPTKTLVRVTFHRVQIAYHFHSTSSGGVAVLTTLYTSLLKGNRNPTITSKQTGRGSSYFLILVPEE